MLYILQEVSMHYKLGKHKKILQYTLQSNSSHYNNTLITVQTHFSHYNNTLITSDKFQSLCSNLNHEYFSVDLIFFKMSGCFSKYE
jgi:hypothetical protein